MKFIKKIKQLSVLLTATVSSSAFAGHNIGNAGASQYEGLTKWFQAYVNFMDGPFAKAAVVASIILAVLAWNFTPRDGIMGGILRTVISGIVVLNVTAWVTSFEGSGS